MPKPSLTVHCLIKNESRWIWYAIRSVLPLTDQIFVWDTGSTDTTQSQVADISSPKIHFHQKHLSNANDHTLLRQQMLDQTRTDWFMILDGDEIWWWSHLQAVINRLHPQIAAVISPFYNCVGDIFHHQSPSRIRYKIHHYQGPYTFRIINRHLPGLCVANPHGRQEYQTNGIAVQKLPIEKLLFVDAPFLHTTHLIRSNRQADSQTLKRGFKYKYELGHPFPKDFTFPEVFYLPRPEIVPSAFIRRPASYILRSALYEPVRLIKNRLISSPKSGY